VNTADVMAILSPIWSTRRVMAKCVRQRIGAVMKWTIAQGLRMDNPTSDAISAALPKNTAMQKHRRALPHAEVAATLHRVRRRDAYPGIRLAFELLVLTATRSGEARNASWDEIDCNGAVWTIPARRMKNGRKHRTPLSDRALDVLDDARELADPDHWVFPSPTGRALHQSTLSGLLRELDIDAIPHGELPRLGCVTSPSDAAKTESRVGRTPGQVGVHLRCGPPHRQATSESHLAVVAQSGHGCLTTRPPTLAPLQGTRFRRHGSPPPTLAAGRNNAVSALAVIDSPSGKESLISSCTTRRRRHAFSLACAVAKRFPSPASSPTSPTTSASSISNCRRSSPARFTCSHR